MLMRTLLVLLALLSFGTSAAGAQKRAYQPDTTPPAGPEVFAVFLTQSTCHWSNLEGFDRTVEQAKLLLSDQAADEDMRFAIRAVALDWEPRRGMEYLLGRFGQFDEVAAGRNWFGADAAEHIWRAEGGTPFTPQLLVFRRTIAETDNRLDYSPNVLVGRFVGLEEITRFVEDGALLPLR